MSGYNWMMRSSLMFVFVGLCLTGFWSCEKQNNCTPCSSVDATEQIVVAPDKAPHKEPKPNIPEQVAPEPSPELNSPQEKGPSPEKIGPEENPEPPKKPLPTPTRCGAPTKAFYKTPSSMGQRFVAKAGSVFRCEELGKRTAYNVSFDAIFKASGGTPTHGYRILRIAYVTQAPAGVFRPTTALVYVPINAQGQCEANASIATVCHGTMGSGPACGPSRFPGYGLDYMALPLAARGYLLVAPDYLGLGMPSDIGHPYLVSEPTVFATLDAVKAVRELAQSGALQGCVGNRMLLVGHSQGGHAALATAQKASQYLPKVQHVGTIAYAPAFGDARVWNAPFTAKLLTTAGTAYLMAFLIGAQRYYKGPALKEWLVPGAAARMEALLESMCFTEFSKFFYTTMPTLGDIFTSKFLSASVACNSGKGNCSSFQPWERYIRQSVVGDFATKVPTLLVQGSLDALVTAKSVQCIEERLRKKSSPVENCVVPTANHSTIVASTWFSLLPWIKSVMAGKTPPKVLCPSNRLPTCQ